MRYLALALVLLTGCATVPAPPLPTTAPCNFGLALVNASLWVQLASEYDASAIQTYNAARRAVDASVVAGGEKPLAVILDVDETVVDNTAFEGRMVRKGITYDKTDWQQWVSESRAKAIPGAAEFLAHARARGVTPFFITNRDVSEEPATRKNLETLGYPLGTAEDTLLTKGEREEWNTSDKSGRREWVASRYRVAAVLGDDLNDFIDAHSASQQERDALVARNAAEWGSRWFILPNPMYGSWESPILEGTKECTALQKKIEALDR
ncbi:MAG: 5'-nucleotidase, lipoprotein e(P4) family [Thermoanaerobaculia bacterium]|nr:5'-nucleotidase, lipoprotein e(P4) family [Thermoanaerobaculia bacterium]